MYIDTNIYIYNMYIDTNIYIYIYRYTCIYICMYIDTNIYIRMHNNIRQDRTGLIFR